MPVTTASAAIAARIDALRCGRRTRWACVQLSALKESVLGETGPGSLGTGKAAGQLQSELVRLARQDPPCTVPVPDGAPVPVNELEYEFNVQRLDTDLSTHEAIERLDVDFEIKIKQRLDPYARSTRLCRGSGCA
jgi:hypothetical protein